MARSRWEQIEELEAVARGERTRGRRVVRVDDGDGSSSNHSNNNNGRNADDDDRGTINGAHRAEGRSSVPAATHRLVLQDCHGTRLYAVELRRIDGIGLGRTALGEKMLLRAGTVLARGTLLIAPDTCLILGGRVDAWHDAWSRDRLRRLRDAVAAAGPGPEERRSS
ncbi:hypothetical protein CDD83_4804 [Cordyceps sp. RAO-2017]|nr:hypothetical protein CDD83_4804 [Cordyceps sp. RAO-2017]